jgi:hypothetical protein
MMCIVAVYHRIGRLGEWKAGRMEEWKNGRMEEWRIERIDLNLPTFQPFGLSLRTKPSNPPTFHPSTPTIIKL